MEVPSIIDYVEISLNEISTKRDRLNNIDVEIDKLDKLLLLDNSVENAITLYFLNHERYNLARDIEDMVNLLDSHKSVVRDIKLKRILND